MMDKRLTLEEAAERVPDGATLAIGGLSMNSTPMAFVRELVRRGVKDLTLVAIVNGMAVDWLVAGGCVRRIVTGLVSFEGFGLAPNVRAAVQRGEVAIEEYSELLLIARLQAEAWNLPFVPAKAGLGTQVLDLHPETLRQETDPATGEAYVAATRLPVDIAVVHAHAADARGNTRVDPKLVWMDSEIVKAAKSTIVTVERIVPEQAFRNEPERTTYPRFVVDAVVEVPWGAYPNSCFPAYSHHAGFFRDYVGAARDPETFGAFWKERVVAPASHAEFIDANGGAATILDIRSRTA
jgi:glutaconate CoA-transferase, subunit A